MIRGMAGSTAGDATPASRPDFVRARFAVEPVEVARVVVPLDGSPFAERALPVADWVAAAVGADVHLVEIVSCDEDAEGAMRNLDSVAHRHHAAGWDVFQRDDVGEAVADTVNALPGGMACLATHGRDRSATLLGSVAASLLDRSSRPVVLVGPEARAVTAVDAPVVVAVDGTTRDDALVPVALGWAARLARPMEIVTVAEPAPTGYREGAAPRRARGPAEPEPYVASLVARTEGAGVAVASRVVYDPISVRDGLVPHLDRVAALVVLGSRHRLGVPRMVLGSHAARIVHDAAVPALAVPLPRGG
jgi:nucleotide-binding universal stress UspA family protein